MQISGVAMGRKKSGQEPKLSVAKIDRDIITKARMISADRGVAAANYLSDILRPTVDRDWAKMVRKAEDAKPEGGAK